MGRLIGIDYGLKRTGIAVTDPLQIIASPLETVPTEKLKDWLSNYFRSEEVDRIIVGMPFKLDGTETNNTQPVRKLIENLHSWFSDIPVSEVDERMTSRMAMQTMLDGGMKKSQRRKKENVDKISAAIILQSFLDQQK